MLTLRSSLGLLLVAGLSSGVASLHGARPDGAQRLDEAFAAAFLADDVDAAVDLYADDAVLYNLGGPPAVGREAIRATLAGFLGAFQVTAFQHLRSRYVTEGRLSTGWAEFELTLVPRAGGPAITLSGRSTTVAERGRDGWRYLHDHASLPQPE